MFLRVELHNHSTESDGSLSVRELVSYFAEMGVRHYALTDHNTCSGYRKLEPPAGTVVLPGSEVTSYHGHILSLGTRQYIDWSDIDPNDADRLFARIREAGGLVGIAHPYSAPRPIGNGIAWAMRIHDWSLVDYIEVINHGNGWPGGNARAIERWMALVLEGRTIAALSGLDLHRPIDWSRAYTSYLDLRGGPFARLDEVDTPEQLLRALRWAIERGRTIISRGPLLYWSAGAEGCWRFELQAAEASPSLPTRYDGPYELRLRSQAGETRQPWDGEALELALDIEAGPVIPTLYQDGELVAIAAVMR